MSTFTQQNIIEYFTDGDWVFGWIDKAAKEKPESVLKIEIEFNDDWDNGPWLQTLYYNDDKYIKYDSYKITKRDSRKIAKIMDDRFDRLEALINSKGTITSIKKLPTTKDYSEWFRDNN